MLQQLCFVAETAPFRHHRFGVWSPSSTIEPLYFLSPHQDFMATSAAANNKSLATSAHRAQLDSHHILQYGPALRTQRQVSDASDASSGETATKRQRNSQSRPAAYSSSSRNTQVSGTTHGENAAAQRAVKSLPRRVHILHW